MVMFLFPVVHLWKPARNLFCRVLRTNTTLIELSSFKVVRCWKGEKKEEGKEKQREGEGGGGGGGKRGYS